MALKKDAGYTITEVVVTVGKTVQEVQYEPFRLEISAKAEVVPGTARKVVRDLYNDLTEELGALIERRMNSN